jgi:hypothetical protein
LLNGFRKTDFINIDSGFFFHAPLFLFVFKRVALTPTLTKQEVAALATAASEA